MDLLIIIFILQVTAYVVADAPCNGDMSYKEIMPQSESSLGVGYQDVGTGYQGQGNGIQAMGYQRNYIPYNFYGTYRGVNEAGVNGAGVNRAGANGESVNGAGMYGRQRGYQEYIQGGPYGEIYGPYATNYLQGMGMYNGLQRYPESLNYMYGNGQQFNSQIWPQIYFNRRPGYNSGLNRESIYGNGLIDWNSRYMRYLQGLRGQGDVGNSNFDNLPMLLNRNGNSLGGFWQLISRPFNQLNHFISQFTGVGYQNPYYNSYDTYPEYANQNFGIYRPRFPLYPWYGIHYSNGFNMRDRFTETDQNHGPIPILFGDRFDTGNENDTKKDIEKGKDKLITTIATLENKNKTTGIGQINSEEIKESGKLEGEAKAGRYISQSAGFGFQNPYYAYNPRTGLHYGNGFGSEDHITQTGKKSESKEVSTSIIGDAGNRHDINTVNKKEKENDGKFLYTTILVSDNKNGSAIEPIFEKIKEVANLEVGDKVIET